MDVCVGGGERLGDRLPTQILPTKRIEERVVQGVDVISWDLLYFKVEMNFVMVGRSEEKEGVSWDAEGIKGW